MLTSILDILGLALLVAAAYIGLGPPVALLVAGLALLWVSHALSQRPPTPQGGSR